jgi:hypothetical protein
MPKPPPSPPRRNYLRILGLGVFILVFACLPILAYFAHDRPWILLVLSFFYIVVAFVLQSRLIVCVLAGIGLGLIFDSGIASDDPWRRVMQYIAQLAIGVVVGIIAGLIWERAALEVDEPVHPRPKKRR